MYCNDGSRGVLCDLSELHDTSDVLCEDNDEVFEYEQNDRPPILRERLKAHLPFWESINANSFIIHLIQSGYRIPFVNTPTRKIFPNNKSALEHWPFVESAITELVNNSAVLEVPFVPHVVSPLSVSVNSSGKKRLILDLRHVNQSVWKEKIKFEDWRIFRSYINTGGYLFSFDLKFWVLSR